MTNPTDEPRTFKDSEIKPHFFSSMYAHYALVSTGADATTWKKRYHNWVNRLRNSNGYWTSASGAEVPFGKNRGWTKVVNIRHTAKGLDILMLLGQFVSADAQIFNHVIQSQFENGAFPQLTDGSEDLWSTSYVMNLLIRAMSPDNLKLTLPRGITIDSWKTTLSNKLERALTWIIARIGDDNLWSIGKRKSEWISEAVIIELGAYLSIKKPEVCRRVTSKLLMEEKDRQAVILYGAALTYNTLSPETRSKVKERIKHLLEQPVEEFNDMLEATSLCKLIFLDGELGILNYYKLDSGGHESCLVSESAWNSSKYFKWCSEKAKNLKQENKINNPIDAAESWLIINKIIDVYRQKVENERGWKQLWNNKNSHKNESDVQVDFFKIAKSISNYHGLVAIREPETGRGPVDFSFINGLEDTILVEFKLATNGSLKKRFDRQIEEYMKGTETHSAILVVIGFDEKDSEIMEIVDANLKKFMSDNKEYYISYIYIDAQYREGASKHK
ncbi:MAG: hypothetical protein AAGG02_16035 [Cyanobacteria bacterium P01_H01_bin.15]